MADRQTERLEGVYSRIVAPPREETPVIGQLLETSVPYSGFFSSMFFVDFESLVHALGRYYLYFL